MLTLEEVNELKTKHPESSNSFVHLSVVVILLTEMWDIAFG